MNKCCDNCRFVDCNVKQAGAKSNSWHSSSDYCSKWEVAEDEVTLKLNSFFMAGKKEDAISLIKSYFKQRIDKSFREVETYISIEGANCIHLKYRKAFDWILNDEN